MHLPFFFPDRGCVCMCRKMLIHTQTLDVVTACPVRTLISFSCDQLIVIIKIKELKEVTFQSVRCAATQLRPDPFYANGQVKTAIYL